MSTNPFPRAALAPQEEARTPRRDMKLDRLYAAPGALEEDLNGFYFTVSPVGTVGALDSSPPATFLAGDGMVYRLALAPGAISVSSELVTDPTRIAEELLHQQATAGVPPYEPYGVAIISLGDDGRGGLGSRLLSNTALVPIARGGAPLLLVTTDGGRPIVVNPNTLESVGALGSVGEWRPALLSGTAFPFVNTTAHPVYDSRTGDLYTVNFARDLLAEIVATLTDPAKEDRPSTRPVPDHVPEALFRFLPPSDADPELRRVLEDDKRRHVFVPLVLDGPFTDEVRLRDGRVGIEASLYRRLQTTTVGLSKRSAWDTFVAIAKSFYRDLGDPFTDLMCWNADGELRRFQVEHDGKPVAIVDSVHQMAVTESYVIFADTQFKFATTLVLSNVLERLEPETARDLRTLLSRRQSSRCRAYFVERRRLATSNVTDAVEAKMVELDAEAVHFFADYLDGDGSRIMLTVVHQRAMDGAEFVASCDLTADDVPVDPELVGMFPMSLDLNDIVRYEIDLSGSTPAVRRGEPYVDRAQTWAIGIGAGPGIGTWQRGRPSPPERIEWTAWYNEGFLPELLTLHTYRLYRDYRGRSLQGRGGAHVALEELRAEFDRARPGSLFRLDSDDVSVALRTASILPIGTQLVSPQWVPSRRSGHAGFLVAVAFRENPGPDEREREVWVFRADDLTSPILRFDADPLGWQYTLHTAWFETVQVDLRRANPEAIAFGRDRASASTSSAMDSFLDRVYGALRGGAGEARPPTAAAVTARRASRASPQQPRASSRRANESTAPRAPRSARRRARK